MPAPVCPRILLWWISAESSGDGAADFRDDFRDNFSGRLRLKKSRLTILIILLRYGSGYDRTMARKIDVLGIPHAYELTAPTQSSTTLVFIHGWLLSRAYWEPMIQRLSSDYRCLSYDLRGFGGSQADRAYRSANQQTEPKPGATFVKTALVEELPPTAIASGLSNTAIAPEFATGYTPADYANDLGVLLDCLNIENAWLVGHSLGGNIALWAADQMPDRVKGVVCINSGGGIYLKEEFEKFRAVGQQLVRLRSRWLCYLPLMDWMMAWMNVARPIARPWGRQRLLDLVMADADAARGALLDSTTENEVHRLPQIVSRLQQPVHFIAGVDDSVMEPQYVLHLASFHPLFQACGSNVTQISKCGHLAMIEHPDRVTGKIREILSDHGA